MLLFASRRRRCEDGILSGCYSSLRSLSLRVCIRQQFLSFYVLNFQLLILFHDSSPLPNRYLHLHPSDLFSTSRFSSLLTLSRSHQPLEALMGSLTDGISGSLPFVSVMRQRIDTVYQATERKEIIDGDGSVWTLVFLSIRKLSVLFTHVHFTAILLSKD